MRQDHSRNQHSSALKSQRQEATRLAGGIKDIRSWPLVTTFQAKGAWT
jgi:hypothetical protein